MFSLDPIGVLLALLFAAAAAILYLKKFFSPKTVLFWPSLDDLISAKGSSKLRLAAFNKGLLGFSFLFFLIALADPSIKELIPSAHENRFFSPGEGIAIYLVLDQSGSMHQYVSPETKEGQKLGTTKIELLRNLTKEFVKGNSSAVLEGRPNDLIGLVAFARTAEVLSPLTMNHRLILDKLSKLDVVKSREWDGTALGYAIYKTAHLIASTKSFYQKNNEPIQNAIMIVVTDGLQDPNPLDSGSSYRSMELEQAAAYAKENNVKVYIVNVDPNLKAEKFAPNLKQIKKIAEETGGKFFIMDSSKGLGEIYATIDKLEKSKLPVQNQQKESYEKRSFYPYFIGTGMLLFALAYLLSSILLRQIP